MPYDPAKDARHRLERLLWQHTRSVDKQEDARGRRHVQVGTVFVQLCDLTDAQILSMLPPVVATTGSPERAVVRS